MSIEPKNNNNSPPHVSAVLAQADVKLNHSHHQKLSESEIKTREAILCATCNVEPPKNAALKRFSFIPKELIQFLMGQPRIGPLIKSVALIDGSAVRVKIPSAIMGRICVECPVEVDKVHALQVKPTGMVVQTFSIKYLKLPFISPYFQHNYRYPPTTFPFEIAKRDAFEKEADHKDLFPFTLGMKKTPAIAPQEAERKANPRRPILPESEAIPQEQMNAQEHHVIEVLQDVFLEFIRKYVRHEGLDEELRYLDISYVYDDFSRISKCTIRLGEDFEISFPFLRNECPYTSGHYLHAVETLRVFVLNNHFACDNPQTLTVLKTIGNTDTTRNFPFRKILSDIRGIRYSNEKEICELFTRSLRVYFPVRESSAFIDSYIQDRNTHYPRDEAARTAVFMNWLTHVLQLPEAEAEFYSQSLAQAEAKEHPMAALLCFKSPSYANHVINYLQGILFYEWLHDNPNVQAFQFPHATNEMRQQLAFHSQGTTYYVRLSNSPLKIAETLFKSWQALEQSMKHEADAKILTNILQGLRCTKITFSQQDKVQTAEFLVQRLSSGTGQKAQVISRYKDGDLMHFYMTVRGIVSKQILQPFQWERQLSVILQREENEKHTEGFSAILRMLRSKDNLTEKEILEIARWVHLNTEPIPENIKSLLILKLFLELNSERQNPHPSHLFVTQKLFFSLLKKNLLTKERDKAISLLISCYQTKRYATDHPHFLEAAAELLCTIHNWENLSKEHAPVIVQLTEVITVELMRLQNQLSKEPVETLAYKCVLALIKVLKPQEALKFIPDILENLLKHALRNPKPQQQRDTLIDIRVEILSKLSQLVPDEQLQERLLKYIAQESAFILRHISVEDVHKVLVPIVRIVLSFQVTQRNLQETIYPFVFEFLEEQLKSRDKPILFAQMFALTLSAFQPNITENLMHSLNRLEAGSHKLLALYYVNDLSDLDQIFVFYQKWVATVLDKDLDNPAIAGQQVSSILGILGKSLAAKRKSEEIEILINHLNISLQNNLQSMVDRLKRLPEKETALIKRTSEAILLACLSQPRFLVKMLPAIKLCMNTGLIDPKLLSCIKDKLMNIQDEDLTTLEKYEHLVNVLDSSFFTEASHKEFEPMCIVLMRKLSDEGLREQRERFMEHLEKRKVLSHFTTDGIVAICRIYYQEKSRRFTELWRLVPRNYSLAMVDLGFFATEAFERLQDKFHKETFQFLYNLSKRSVQNMYYTYSLYLKIAFSHCITPEQFAIIFEDFREFIEGAEKHDVSINGIGLDDAGKKRIRHQFLTFVLRFARVMKDIKEAAKKLDSIFPLIEKWFPRKDPANTSIYDDIFYLYIFASPDFQVRALEISRTLPAANATAQFDYFITHLFFVSPDNCDHDDIRQAALDYFENALAKGDYPVNSDALSSLIKHISKVATKEILKAKNNLKLISMAFKMLKMILQHKSKERIEDDAKMSYAAGPTELARLMEFQSVFIKTQNAKRVIEVDEIARFLNPNGWKLLVEKWISEQRTTLNDLTTPTSQVQTVLQRFHIMLPVYKANQPVLALSCLAHLLERTGHMLYVRGRTDLPLLANESEQLYLKAKDIDLLTVDSGAHIKLLTRLISIMANDAKPELTERALHYFAELIGVTAPEHNDDMTLCRICTLNLRILLCQDVRFRARYMQLFEQWVQNLDEQFANTLLHEILFQGLWILKLRAFLCTKSFRQDSFLQLTTDKAKEIHKFLYKDDEYKDSEKAEMLNTKIVAMFIRRLPPELQRSLIDRQNYLPFLELIALYMRHLTALNEDEESTDTEDFLDNVKTLIRSLLPNEAAFKEFEAMLCSPTKTEANAKSKGADPK